MFSPVKGSNFWNFIWGKPIPISNLVEGWLLATRPLTTGMGYLSYLITSTLTDFELRPEFLDADWFSYLKEISMLLVSIKTLDKNLYQKNLFLHMKAHWFELIELLKKYKTEKENFKGSGNGRDKGLYKVEDEIKEFILNSQSFSFTYWLKQKNYAFARNEMLVNLALNATGIAVQSSITYFKEYKN